VWIGSLRSAKQCKLMELKELWDCLADYARTTPAAQRMKQNRCRYVGCCLTVAVFILLTGQSLGMFYLRCIGALVVSLNAASLCWSRSSFVVLERLTVVGLLTAWTLVWLEFLSVGNHQMSQTEFERGYGYIFILQRIVPVMMALPHFLSVPYLLWITTLDIVGPAVLWSHGSADKFLLLRVLAGSILSFILSLSQQSRSKGSADWATNADRQSVKFMLEGVFQAIFKVDADCDTITCGDVVVDSVIGHCSGKRYLSRIITAKEVQRLRKALSDAVVGDVFWFDMTIRGNEESSVRADLVVVDQGAHLPAERFLVGISVAEEVTTLQQLTSDGLRPKYRRVTFDYRKGFPSEGSQESSETVSTPTSSSCSTDNRRGARKRSKRKSKAEYFIAKVDTGVTGIGVDVTALDPNTNDLHNGISIGQNSINSEMPITTDTGQIFTALANQPRKPKVLGNPMTFSEDTETRDTRQRLEKLADLGEQEGWLLDAQDVMLQPENILGVGGFGMVVRGWLHGTAVAVKIPKVTETGSHVAQMMSMANELRILRKVRHPNIVLFFGACVETGGSEIFIALEYVQGESMRHFLARLKPDAAPVRYRLLDNVVCALRYLHAQDPHIVHGDLKDSNIMVEPVGPNAKLLDFGLSRILTRNVQPLGGTLHWVAPELIRNPKILPQASADVFSFGRVAYMIITGIFPLVGLQRKDIISAAKEGKQIPLTWSRVPLMEECKQLVVQTSLLNPKGRPTMRQVHDETQQWNVPVKTGSISPALFADVSAAISLEHASQKGVSVSNEAVAASRKELMDAEKRAHRDGGKAVTKVQQDLEPKELIPRVFSHRIATNRQAKVMTIIDVLTRWNFENPDDACCAYHAGIHALDTLLKGMHQRSCITQFLPSDAWQCKTCGILDFEDLGDDNCEICGRSSTQGNVPQPKTRRVSDLSQSFILMDSAPGIEL